MVSETDLCDAELPEYTWYWVVTTQYFEHTDESCYISDIPWISSKNKISFIYMYIFILFIEFPLYKWSPYSPTSRNISPSFKDMVFRAIENIFMHLMKWFLSVGGLALHYSHCSFPLLASWGLITASAHNSLTRYWISVYFYVPTIYS